MPEHGLVNDCLLLRMLVNFTDIDTTKYLVLLEWKDVNNERKRVMNHHQKRKEHNSQTQQFLRHSSSSALVNEKRKDPAHFSSKEREENCSSQVIDNL